MITENTVARFFRYQPPNLSISLSQNKLISYWSGACMGNKNNLIC